MDIYKPVGGMEAAKKYRPEIQGLRAIAALLVAVYHIWFSRVSGGVDVFFVVSGFLITSSLARQAEQTGGIEFTRFWSGLAKRLFPAAMTVITVTLIASILLLPKVAWIPVIKQAASALLYVENWYSAYQSIDYLADRDGALPFLHYWALSVQGQFYLLWPILIGLILFVGRIGKVDLLRLLFLSLGLIFILSLGYSIWLTGTNQPFAYFNTFARVWEFSLGGLLALALPYIKLNMTAKLIMGWVGLLAIISCGAVFSVSSLFPGYAALWPTIGAVFVIVAGTTTSSFGADKLLSSKPLAYFGDISYSFYLWHWPLLVFYKLYTETEDVNFFEGLLIIGASFFLAIITTRLIEQPIRFSSIGKKTPVLGLAFSASLALPAVLLLAGWSFYTIEVRDRQVQISKTLSDDLYPGAAIFWRTDIPDNLEVSDVYPGSFILKNDLPVSYEDGCHQDPDGAEAHFCVYGDSEGELVLALVGGSHSAQWLPALRKLGKANSWKILNFTKSACWFSDEIKYWRGQENLDCKEWNTRVLAQLKELRPDFVFTMATRAEGQEELTPLGYINWWRELNAEGIDVLAIRDNPWSNFDLSECVDVYGANAERCSLERRKVLASVNPALVLDDIPDNVHLIDLTDYLCDEERCFPVIGNIMVYRDKHHLTATFVKTLTPILESQLKDKL